MGGAGSEARPRGIRQVDQTSFAIQWEDGHESVYPSLYLRARCICARCVDEMTNERMVFESDIDPDVHPVKIRQTGAYAITITWSDGHDTGIFDFVRLRALCPCASCAGRTENTPGEVPS